jgi:hypothetical protein
MAVAEPLNPALRAVSDAVLAVTAQRSVDDVLQGLVERVWEELVLHADDFRAVPGFVVVMGHVDLRSHGRAQRRAVVWTWRLRDGLATYVRVADLGELPPA